MEVIVRVFINPGASLFTLGNNKISIEGSRYWVLYPYPYDKSIIVVGKESFRKKRYTRSAVINDILMKNYSVYNYYNTRVPFPNRILVQEFNMRLQDDIKF